MSHQFPNALRTYKDTLKKGSITVRGFALTTDEEGFIEGPADIAKEIEPHGFVPMVRPAKQQGLPGGKK